MTSGEAKRPSCILSSLNASTAPYEMTTTMSGINDPDKPSIYPIVLSDALLGRGTKEAVTAIRCKIRHYSPLSGMLIKARWQTIISPHCPPNQFWVVLN